MDTKADSTDAASVGAPRRRKDYARMAGDAVMRARGRRGVHIYALPQQQLADVILSIIFIGIPAAFFISMIPLWESYGRVPWVAAVATYTVPAVHSVDFSFRLASMPDFPLKRFFVAISSTVELLVLVNFAMLAFRRFRRRAILVWLCFDHGQLLRIAGWSGAILAVVWSLLFCNLAVLYFMAESRQAGIRIAVYSLVALPLAALVFGHVGAIMLAGCARDIQEALRRRRPPTGRANWNQGPGT